MNFFNQGLPLGRWFGIAVIIHWTFFIYAANELFGGSSHELPMDLNILYIFLLFGTVLVHEFGHALSCKAMGGQAPLIILWPLGGIAFVQPKMTPTAWLVSTVCGPLVNAILWPVFWFLSSHLTPILITSPNPPAINIFILNACYLMYEINRGLLLFNLIPAYPMDGGRILQELLWYVVGYPRSLLIAGMVGTVAGAGFIAIGLGLQSIHIPVIDFNLGTGQVDTMLVIIGLLAAMQSFAIYRQSQQIQSSRKN